MATQVSPKLTNKMYSACKTGNLDLYMKLHEIGVRPTMTDLEWSAGSNKNYACHIFEHAIKENFSDLKLSNRKFLYITLAFKRQRALFLEDHIEKLVRRYHPSYNGTPELFKELMSAVKKGTISASQFNRANSLEVAIQFIRRYGIGNHTCESEKTAIQNIVKRSIEVAIQKNAIESLSILSKYAGLGLDKNIHKCFKKSHPDSRFMTAFTDFSLEDKHYVIQGAVQSGKLKLAKAS